MGDEDDINQVEEEDDGIMTHLLEARHPSNLGDEDGVDSLEGRQKHQH